jgi:transposase
MAHAPPATTVSSGGEAGVWGRIIDALAAGHDAAVQMIDTSIVRVHQHAATRYDKLAANYLAFIQLTSIRLWLCVL